MCIIVQKLNHISIRILFDTWTCDFHSFWKNVNLKVKKRKKVVCGLPYTCIGNIYKRLLSYNELLWEN